MADDIAVGIDLGTTHSYIAYWPMDARRPPTIANCGPDDSVTEDYENLGAWAAMTSKLNILKTRRDGAFVIIPDEGELRDHESYHPVARTKRLLGLVRERQMLDEYRVDCDPSGGEESNYARPEAVAAVLLAEMRNRMLTRLNIRPQQLNGATITVPALAKANQRKATQFAARLAGFRGEVFALEEPVAAFLYHYHSNGQLFESLHDDLVLVLDFGGGTFDTSLVRVSRGRLPVVVDRQMGHFGGEDIDLLVVEKWLRGTKGAGRLNLDELEPHQLRSVRNLAQRAKEALLRHDPAVVRFGYVSGSTTLGERKLTRSTLAKLLDHQPVRTTLNEADKVELPMRDLITRLLGRLLHSAGGDDRRIKVAILAGGSSKLHWVRTLLLGQLPHLCDQMVLSQSAEVSIALGAAIHQHYRRKGEKLVESQLASDIRLDHSYNHDLGSWGGSIVLARAGQTLPSRTSPLLPMWATGVKKSRGSVRVRVVQARDDDNPLLDESMLLGRWPVAHLEVSCGIGEDGAIEWFSCRPGSLLLPPMALSLVARIRKSGVVSADPSIEGLLRSYDLSDAGLIERLRGEYGIRVD